MQVNKLKPRKALNKAYLKVKPNRTEIEGFKANLIQLIDQTNDTESEEFHKNLVSDFLKKTYYDRSKDGHNHFINTKGRNDLVIHNGDKAQSSVGVIIEAKKPTNKTEMVTTEKLNTKALQELLLYYLRERISLKNLEIKYLIATNINEWFVFDANIFEKNFAENKNLIRQFEDFEGGRLAGKTTDFFYKEIAEPFIAGLENTIEFTHFDLNEYDRPLRSNDSEDDNKLIALFKLLSPEHLLKLPFANDSNSLDKKFYSELLHIIGLTETKDGGKKVIQRNEKGKRHTGSLLENAIIQLDSLDKIYRLENPSQYGETMEDRLFNVGLELSITWVNRILFLKLLEAQLITYHKVDGRSADPSYSFLNFAKINNYDDLNSLFFQVLAKKHQERNEDVKDEFAKVPYLNSSLFEPSELEHNTILISNLRDEKKLPILPGTVLKDDNGKRLTGELNALEYFFAFLEAYDFSSEGSENIQEDNKTLINASVLGLIFEKINGYKDGSFFTPGFITMYMCRETIRRSVVQKFNEATASLLRVERTAQHFKTLDDVYDVIGTDDKSLFTRQEANDIVNSLKICDPAVGSGHFLVSALNEMIAIKHDLKILQDRDGRRLKEYVLEVLNDELVITDDDGELFEYRMNHKESLRLQETLFHEKQTIIENCLFGVDINPNSVKICRLRLWIELLKNAYYKNETELETLPNIDINIKCGNSLISRFDLDTDVHAALKRSKWTIESYRIAVETYRNAQSKEEKHAMERLISDIKSDFQSEISKNDPKVKKLYRLSGELATLTTQTRMFEMGAKEKKDWKKKVEKLTKETKKLETEIEEIKNNKIYENAFEWRFEFPEVLNDEGDFVGFDVVIGNPPYVFGRDWKALGLPKSMKVYFKEQYQLASYQIDFYILFLERSFLISKDRSNTSLIVPNSWLNNTYAGIVRKYLLSNTSEFVLATTPPNTFEGVGVDTVIVQFHKGVASSDELIIKSVSYQDGIELLQTNDKRLFIDGKTPISLNMNDASFKILSKINGKGSRLGDLCNVTRGIHPYRIGGYGKSAFSDGEQTERDLQERPYHSTERKKHFRPFIYGKDLRRLGFPRITEFVNYGEWIAEPRNPAFFEGERVYSRKILGNKLIVMFVDDDSVADQQVYITKPKTKQVKAAYLTGVLGSTVVGFFIRNFYDELEALFPQIKVSQLKQLPIPIPASKLQSSISLIVTQIQSLKKENPEADTTALEAEIDQLVYQLYDLTEEEIEIVENAVK
ncbi:MAG: TaqI-like C-terminal specificity domain-containing protein [Bacteroidota bacterium]